MQAIRPNGDEVLATGSKEAMEILAQKERDIHGSEAKVFSEGETFGLQDGRRATVTSYGLVIDHKKKAKNRKKNKVARAARRKARR